MSENVSLKRRRGNVAKQFKNGSAKIYNLKKNSMIDVENRVAKSRVTVFFACRYDSGEQRNTLY
jgi:hypothetical protein